MEFVRKIVTQPYIYRNAIDDGAPPVEQFEPNAHPEVWYVAAWYGGTCLGMLAFVPVNTITWQVHCCLLKDCWGQSALVGVLVFRWIFESTVCQRIEARIPVFNRLALRAARKSGMMSIAVLKDSFLKGGKVWDEELFAVRKEDTPCRQR
jgi:RimJ/RimL family protein N-acetyltransferase